MTGLDIVPGMLALARRKAADLPIRWIEGDARTFDLGAQFRLIFVTGNAFQAFVTRAYVVGVAGIGSGNPTPQGIFTALGAPASWPA